MAHILILGGGAAGLAAALAAAQTDPTARVTVLERSPRPGKKLLATGNGRCNLDNEGITPESYSSADRAALDALLRALHTECADAAKERSALKVETPRRANRSFFRRCCETSSTTPSSRSSTAFAEPPRCSADS